MVRKTREKDTFLAAFAKYLAAKASGIFIRNISRIFFVYTWNRRMSRGLPAFFRQFWLHFRKNFNWNLNLQ
jgi:hypothetical protein